MSLRSLMIRPWRRHLSDARVFDLWVDGGSDPHLAACEACAERLNRLAADMSEWREDARQEADAAFTPDRLDAQRAAITRRLDNAQRPPQVIAFPAPVRTPVPSRPNLSRRIIAGAAAAGLLIGLLAGQLVRFDPASWTLVERFAAVRRAPAEIGRVTGTASQAANGVSADDLFLMEIEQALLAPSVAELQAIEAFTPRVTEVSVSR